MDLTFAIDFFNDLDAKCPEAAEVLAMLLKQNEKLTKENEKQKKRGAVQSGLIKKLRKDNKCLDKILDEKIASIKRLEGLGNADEQELRKENGQLERELENLDRSWCRQAETLRNQDDEIEELEEKLKKATQSTQ